MKNLYCVGLLAALGLATTTVASAQTTPAAGDLLLGFNDAAGPTSAQNDYVVDLGSATQFTTTTTVDLSSLFSATTFNSAFGTDGNSLVDVAVGAVGGNGTGANKQFYQTLGIGSGLGSSSIATAIQYAGPTYGEYASSTVDGWSDLVAVSPTAIGANAAGSVSTASENPTSYLSSGIVTESLWEATLTGSGRNAVYATEELGNLTINLNTDSVSFAGVDAVPEPTTLALAGLGGLSMFLLRRKK